MSGGWGCSLEADGLGASSTKCLPSAGVASPMSASRREPEGGKELTDDLARTHHD